MLLNEYAVMIAIIKFNALNKQYNKKKHEEMVNLTGISF